MSDEEKKNQEEASEQAPQTGAESGAESPAEAANQPQESTETAPEAAGGATPPGEEEPSAFDMSGRRDFGVIVALLAIVAIVAAAAVVFLREGGPTGPRPSETALEGDAIARVGDREIKLDEFKVWLASLPQSVHMQLGSPQGRRAVLQQYLNRIAIDEYARAQGVYETEAFQEELENTRRMLAVRELVEETFRAQASKDDLRKYYNDNQGKFPKPFGDESQRYQLIEDYRRDIISRFSDTFLKSATVQKAEDFSEPVIAQIVYEEGDKDTITLEDWETELSSLSSEQQRWSRTPKGRDELLQRLLRRKVLARIAEQRDYGARPAVEEGLKELRPHIAAKVLATEDLQDVDALVDDEVKNNKGEYEDSRMEIAHIMVRTPPQATDAQATKAKARIQDLHDQITGDKASFEDVAREYSEDPNSAAEGGKIGEVSKGELVRPMAETAFELKQGEVSEPVRTMFGFHLIKAISEPTTEYDESVARVMARRNIMESAINETVGKIVTEMKVTINDPLIESWDPVSQFLEQQAQQAGSGPMPGSNIPSPAPSATPSPPPAQ